MIPFTAIGSVPDAPRYKAAVVFAQDYDGRVLMQLRDDWPGIAAPGQWCLFGGGVDEGEDLRAAAAREFREETGVALALSILEPAVAVASEWHEDGVLYVFRATRHLEPHSIRLGEGAGFAFLTPAQCASYPLVPSAAAILRGVGVLGA